MLDDAIRRDQARQVGGDCRAWTRRPDPPVMPAFLFDRPMTVAAPRWTTPDVLPQPRPAHALTGEQRQAFDRLALLGATLLPGFTAEELRHEYRRLACRYHPDRHADCSAVERLQLARCFGDAADAYRCLRAVVEPRH